MGYNFSEWFKHPSYFLFWLLLGYYGLSFTFEKSDDTTAAVAVANRPTREVTSVHNKKDLSASDGVDTSEFTLDQNISTGAEEEQFAEELKKLKYENEKVSEAEPLQDFVVSEDEIESYQANSEGTLDKDEAELKDYLKRKNEFKFESVSAAEDLSYLVRPEDGTQCSKDRNYIEGMINNNSRLGEWANERKTESKNLPRKCIAFVMNSFPELRTKAEAVSFKSKSSQTFAKCPKGSGGGPALKGGGRTKNPVPCVSKNLVNLTYNAFVDVMSCLKIEPKDLLPKIYNESGFFINALGGGMDGGIGQLTKPAIEQVNSIYPKYIEEITKAAAAKPDGACARILKNKAMILPAKADSNYRCNLLWPSENPVRNILYAGILTRYNMKYVSGVTIEAGEEVIADGDNRSPLTGASSDQYAGKMKEYEIPKKLKLLGYQNPDLYNFQKMITLAGYNSGIGSAMNVFNSYLEQRIAANQRSKSNKYNLKPSDFDFVSTIAQVKEARSYLMSSFIKPGLKPADRAEKVRRRKQLPSVWGSAYAKTFPEYIALRLNAYKGDSSGKYQIYGFPGYLSALAEKNKMIRETFQSAGEDPNFCSSPHFLNFK